jgi:hypothetical protein
VQARLKVRARRTSPSLWMEWSLGRKRTSSRLRLNQTSPHQRVSSPTFAGRIVSRCRRAAIVEIRVEVLSICKG